ncbi:GLIPR1-like protein 1 [Holothuria leucospilota]|uniref:GLIPR1-like protein 1 n=1 Tax=Holothuria leucospilota TaxID=206669 RepID=A0A9Q1CCK3_HOLLE|nr:GLIPR1-like protein 1 [Holothuria leucospilota]
MALLQLCVILVISFKSMAQELPALIEKRAGGTDYSLADQKALLDVHNEYRKNVSPRAARMNTLTWDTTLAIKAQQWVERCHFGHPNTAVHTDYAGLGQNLYIRRGTTTPPSVTAPVVSWYNEVRDYNLATNTCNSGKVCGHYTQIVWADTTKVGCGTNYCPQATSDYGITYRKAWLVACQYSPGGNVRGQKPYNAAG